MTKSSPGLAPATAATAPQDKATCLVSVDGLTVEVTAPATGRKLTLTFAEEDALYRRVTEGVGYLPEEQLVALDDIRELLKRSRTADSGNFLEGRTQGAIAARLDNHVGRRAAGQLEAAQEVVKKIETETLWMLQYDIPKVLDKACPNPSWLLWRHGFRLTDSCWILPDSGLKSPLVQELLEHWERFPELEHYLFDYSERCKQGVLAAARKKLEEEIRRCHTKLIKDIIKADAYLEKAEKAWHDDPTAGDADKDYDFAVRHRHNLVRGA